MYSRAPDKINDKVHFFVPLVWKVRRLGDISYTGVPVLPQVNQVRKCDDPYVAFSLHSGYLVKGEFAVAQMIKETACAPFLRNVRAHSSRYVADL